MKSSAELSIGGLARKFGLATSVLRHWEQAGALPRAARAGGRRRYERSDEYRVALVLICQESGFTLDETRRMQRASDPARRRMIARKRAELDARIARLLAARQMLDEALACPERDPVRCPDFRAALEARIGSVRERAALDGI